MAAEDRTSACAQEADPADVAIGDVEYEATPEFVAAAAERSVSFEFGRDAMAEALGQEAIPSAFPVDVAFTLDLFDYGDESIDIELPADAIDVTDAFREMLESSTGIRGT